MIRKQEGGTELQEEADAPRGARGSRNLSSSSFSSSPSSSSSFLRLHCPGGQLLLLASAALKLPGETAWTGEGGDITIKGNPFVCRTRPVALSLASALRYVDVCT